MPRQLYKSFLEIWKLHYAKPDIFFSQGLGRIFAAAPSVDESQLHRFANDIPNFLGQRLHLDAILLVGRYNSDGQQVAFQVFTYVCIFIPFIHF